MAKTVEEIREVYYTYQHVGSKEVGTLLAEIERLDKWSAELVTANAGLGLQAVEALTRLADAEAVCEALDEWNRVGVPPFTSAEWHGITEAYKAWLVGKEDC